MKINRIDHIGVIVNDFDAAKAFFVDFGLEVRGEAKMEGELLDQLLALHGVKTEFASLGTADGEATIELIKFLTPTDEKGIQESSVNTLGIRHIAFEVEDLEGIVAKLKANGAEIFSEIQNYEDSYKICYVRGPEGIILDLNEKIN